MMGNDNEDKEDLDLMLRSLADSDDPTSSEEEPDDALVRKCLKAMEGETSRLLGPKTMRAMLLAASEKREQSVKKRRFGIAYGVAVDPEVGTGALIECAAHVSEKEVENGDISFIVQEVTGIKRGKDAIEITPPFDSLKDKLRELFLHNAYLERFRLNHRDSVVEIVCTNSGQAVIREAKSLELTVIMALLSALTGRKIGEETLFSARVRLDGALKGPVGDVPLKLRTARSGGKKEIILPEVNLEDCPPGFLQDSDLSVVFFSHISQVTQHLGIPYEPPGEKSMGATASPPKIRGGVPAPELKALWKSSPETASKRRVVQKALEMGIPEYAIVAVMKAAEDLAQIRNELNPVSTALIIGDRQKSEAILPPAEMELQRRRAVGEMLDQLGMLSSVVNGDTLGFLINKEGVVDSIRKLNVEPQESCPINPLLGWSDRKFAFLSAVTDSVIFYLTPASNRIHLFCDGEFISKYINGGWVTVDFGMLEELLRIIAGDKGYDLAPVIRVARSAVRMSGLNLGGLFVIYPERMDLTGKYDNCLKTLDIEFGPRPLENITEEDLINLAKEDGAILINARGVITTFMAYLTPRPTTPVEIEMGAGGRRINAQRFSAEAGCLAIVVSEDGSVTFYCDGRRVFRT